MTEFSVLKFGGTSAAAPERSAEIFTENPEQNRVAVLSAIGKDHGVINGVPKVTDALLSLEEAVDTNNRIAIREAQEFVVSRTVETYSFLGEDVLREARDYMRELLQLDKRLDGYAWIGEHMSARLFAKSTGALYMPSDLRFSGGVLNKLASLKEIQKRILPALETGRQVVTEGFFGYDMSSGRVEVLPRGGSDTSGVVYTGALLQAQPGRWSNLNYTDKDGILSGDPGLVDKPRTIPEMTHEEVREKMHGVIDRNGPVHGDAIAWAYWLDVPMTIKNTFNPEAQGTKIMPHRDSDPEHPIIGISGKGDSVSLDVFDMGMADAKNYLLRIFEMTGKLDVSIANVPTGEDRLKLVFNSDITDENLDLVQKFILKDAISNGKARAVIRRDEGAVYLVGQELTYPLTYTRTLGRVASKLVEVGLPIREIISHEKSPSLAMTVDGADVPDMVRILHRDLVEAS